DDVDLEEQLRQWMTEIADMRIHGTTHERPIDRFGTEQRHLLATAGHPSFRLEARQPRIVAEDYLVSFETNRYSVPFTLVGQSVEVLLRQGRRQIFQKAAQFERLQEHLSRLRLFKSRERLEVLLQDATTREFRQ